jgi:hypothetical protein
MKKILLALTAAAAFAGLPSFAGAAPAAPAVTPQTTPQATAAAKAVLDAMEVRKTMAATFADMEKQVPSMMRLQLQSAIQANPSMSADQKQAALAAFEKALPGMTEAVHRIFADPALVDDIVAEMAPLYASHFSLAELNELAAFYRTPLGRKVMLTTPKLSAQGMAIGQKIVTPRLNKLMQDIMQGVQKQ